MNTPSYSRIVRNGKVVSKDNYHSSFENCDCKPSQPLAKHRDIVVEYNDKTYNIFHSTPVVIKAGLTVKLSSGGWKTASTKQRINKYLPNGYRVKGTDDTRRTEPEWVMSTPEQEVEFEDGMEVDIMQHGDIRTE